MSVWHKCPDCKNDFAQEFKCITCGAEKLYDATVRNQAKRIEVLEAVLQDIASGELGLNLCIKHARKVVTSVDGDSEHG